MNNNKIIDEIKREFDGDVPIRIVRAIIEKTKQQIKDKMKKEFCTCTEIGKLGEINCMACLYHNKIEEVFEDEKH